MRLRLTDRKVDLTTEGLDLAFFLGQPEDSNLRIRKIADVPAGAVRRARLYRRARQSRHRATI